jgi:succinylglutamate desuccinylase
MKVSNVLIGLLLFGQMVLAENPYAQKFHNLVDGPVPFGDAGTQYPKYSDIEKNLATLAARFPEKAKLVQYGKTPSGLNLNLLRIEKVNSSKPLNRVAIEISGAIHGNEFLGIEDYMIQYFLENEDKMPGLSAYLAGGGVLYMIPVVNPDGFSRRERQNSADVDLNRDFDILPTKERKFTQPETELLAAYIDKDLNDNKLNLRFTLDYHCCVPAFITPWTYVDSHPGPDDASRFEFFEQLQTQTLGYDVGNAADTVGYLAAGSSVDYFYAKYGTAAFTIEGKYGGEMKDFDKHIRFLDGVFKQTAARMLKPAL